MTENSTLHVHDKVILPLLLRKWASNFHLLVLSICLTLSLVSKKLQRSSSKNAVGVPDDEEGPDAATSPDAPPVPPPEDVLIVAFGNQGNDCPGMISEAKVRGVKLHPHQDIYKNNLHPHYAIDQSERSNHIRQFTNPEAQPIVSEWFLNSTHNKQLTSINHIKQLPNPWARLTSSNQPFSKLCLHRAVDSSSTHTESLTDTRSLLPAWNVPVV